MFHYLEPALSLHADSPPSLLSQFHYVRYHALFCDLSNTETSRRTSHDDYSALVDRAAYEILGLRSLVGGMGLARSEDICSSGCTQQTGLSITSAGSIRMALGSFVDSLRHVPGDMGAVSHLRALRLIVRLGQPFSAFLVAQLWRTKKIASDRHTVAQVKDVTSVRSVLDDRTIKVYRISKNRGR